MSKPTAIPAQADGVDSERGPNNGMLVGLDGSNGSRRALEWAAARTDRFGLIQPLTAWNCPWWSYAGPTPPPSAEFARMARQRAESVLGSIRSDQYLPLILCQGQAGPILVEAGAGRDLIVVGTHGRTALKDALLGSVSSHVVAHASSPIAVVPTGAPIDDVHKRVIVGVDGSPNSVEALRWALGNTAVDSTIEVVHTWSYPVSALPEMAVNPRSDFEDWGRDTLDRTVDTALKTFDQRASDDLRRRIVKRLEYGDARSVLRELGVAGDLLVVGARGRGAVAHLLIGSVTSALVHQPRTTMVVVPSTGIDRSG